MAAYMPNIPEAIAAFLATASIGAVWSSCSPDFGARSVIDRFAQIEPKVLFAVDGYRYGGRDFDRRDVVAQLQEARPSLARTLRFSRTPSAPRTRKEPDSGSMAVERTRRSVLFPEPLGPTRPKTSPRPTARLTSTTPRPLLL